MKWDLRAVAFILPDQQSSFAQADGPRDGISPDVEAWRAARRGSP